MKILVTGGAGFLGSHLCDALLAQGHTVICVDNLLTGSRDNITHLMDNEGFTFIEQDIIQGLPDATGVDRIYNLACPASPIHYQQHAVQTLRVCTEGMRNVLEVAKTSGIRVLQASTSEVYGDPLTHPQTEQYWGNVNSYGPRSCYDEGKRAAEAYCYEFEKAGVQVRIARIFNTYGPRMALNDGRVVSNFITQALSGEDLTVYGDGSQTRSFCYVSDLVAGLIALMESDQKGPVNLGNPIEFTIQELAEAVIKLTSGVGSIVHRPLPTDDPTRRQPDIGKAEQGLGWKPRIQLEDGLTQTIPDFSQRLSKA